MKNPDLVYKILNAMVKAVHKPVTVKFRKGFDEQHVNAVEIAKAAEAAGAAAVAVHGRTREQYYSGTADWSIIRQVKAAVSIPVIGNGDIFEPQDAKRMLEETGCDFLMLARGVRGNPWLFRRTDHYLKTGELLPVPDAAEVKSMILKHAALQQKYKGDYIGVRELRKLVAWYTTGLAHSASLRQDINQAETMDDLKKLIEARL